MKTGREWLLVESSKLQHRRQTVADSYCVIRNLTVESAELSDHNVSTNERRHERAVVADTGIHTYLSDKMVQHGGVAD